MHSFIQLRNNLHSPQISNRNKEEGAIFSFSLYYRCEVKKN